MELLDLDDDTEVELPPLVLDAPAVLDATDRLRGALRDPQQPQTRIAWWALTTAITIANPHHDTDAAIRAANRIRDGLLLDLIPTQATAKEAAA